jgi:hypothetical protein
MTTTQTAQSEILEKVNEIKKTIPGGPAFFDALDKEIIETASPAMITELFGMVPRNHFLVLSGGFGKKIASGIEAGTLPQLPYYLYNGGIRSGKTPEMIGRKHFIGKNYHEGVFLDDSIYGGATYEALKKCFSGIQKLKKCAVIYDGCPIKKTDISAVFRYYDHFKAIPNYKF